MDKASKKTLEYLFNYLEQREVSVKWDTLEECFIVVSDVQMDVSKYHRVEDAFKWAIEMAEQVDLSDD